LSEEVPKFGGFSLIFTHWLKLAISNFTRSLVCQIDHTNNKIKKRHDFVQNLAFFNDFAMAEVALAVYNKRYYIEKTQNINVQTLYTSVIDSHMENSKNWNYEFSCGACRRCDNTTKFTKAMFAVFDV